MHNPGIGQVIDFTLLLSQTFSTFTQYKSVSHGYSTMGGIEYNDVGYVEKTKKEKVSYRLGVSTGYGDAHQ